MPTQNRPLTKAELGQFTGTEYWYRHWAVRSILYTDGVKYVADSAGAYWLLDEIVYSQRVSLALAAAEFQVWKLNVNANRSAILTCKDSKGNVLFTEPMQYTNFPLDEFTLYFTDLVFLLPSEYPEPGLNLYATICKISLNACKGIPTEALEQGIVRELVETLELAINQLEEWLVGFPKNTDDTPEIVEILRVTLGKVKGAKPEKDTGDAGHDPATTTPQALLTDFIARISAVNSDLLAHGISVMRYELEHRPDADHIFAVWHVEDVRNRRPDLTHEACREVLREMNRHLDAEKGINWKVIDAVAELLYPAPANLNELRENAEN